MAGEPAKENIHGRRTRKGRCSEDAREPAQGVIGCYEAARKTAWP